MQKVTENICTCLVDHFSIVIISHLILQYFFLFEILMPDKTFFLCSVDNRYNNLQLQAANRRHKLLDALSLHQLNRDAYIVDSWINEKVSWMNKYNLSVYLRFKDWQSR